MRLLLDECVPRPLKRELGEHTVSTVGEMGWAGAQNGELLALIREAAFEAFVTVDQNLAYQQNLRAIGIGSSFSSPVPASSRTCCRSYPLCEKLSRGYRPAS